MEKINSNHRRQKILFLITQSEWGGAQQFLYQIVTHLDQKKYDMTIAIGKDGDGSLISAFKDIPVVTLPSLRRNPHPIQDIISIFAIRRLLKKVRPDIFFLLSSKAGFNGSLAVRFPWTIRPTPRVIYRIGGWTFNDPWSAPKKFFYFLFEYISAHWKDIIIVNSKHDLEQAHDFEIKPRHKLALIHNGIDLKSIQFLERAEARAKLDLNDNDFVIGSIANYYPAKGLTYLIEALKDVPNSKAVLIGQGKEKEKLQQQIQSLQLENRVRLVTLNEPAAPYLKAFDCFVLPSVKEGFPWTILEAVVARVPIIATSVGAVPEIITNHREGIVVSPANSRALTDAIIYMQNKEHRQRYAEAAFSKIHNDFSIAKMMAFFEDLFR